MTKDGLGPERRRQKVFERLGSNNPRCVNCGEDTPACLEKHHIAGRAFADEEVIVCCNCHRTLSDKQFDHPRTLKPQLGSPPNLLIMIAKFLLGVADLFELLISTFRVIATHLINHVRDDAAKPLEGKP